MENCEINNKGNEASQMRKVATFGAGVLVLFAVAANVAGGFAFFQVSGDLFSAAMLALIGAATVMTVTIAYIFGVMNIVTWVLHAFGVALLSFAFQHFGDSLQQDASIAERDLRQAEKEIDGYRSDILKLEKQLDGLSAPADGMDSIAIAAKIKTLKNTKVKGGTLWDKSRQCKLEAYAPSCGVIKAWEAKAKAEEDRLSGTLQESIKREIAVAKGNLVEAERLAKDKKTEIEKKSVFGKNIENPEMVLSIVSKGLAVTFELMLGFMLWLAVTGWSAKKQRITLTKRPPNISSKPPAKLAVVADFISGTILAKKQIEAEKAANEARIEREKTMQAIAEGKAKVAVARCELEVKKLDSEINTHNAGLRISDYLKHITESDLKKIMMNRGISYRGKAGEKLLANINRSLSMFDSGQAMTKRGMSELLNERFSLPTAETHGRWKAADVGDVSPYVTPDYVLSSLFPALVKMGLMKSEGETRLRYSWVSIIEARKAVGADVIMEGSNDNHAKDVMKEPVANKVRKFEVISGGRG